MNTSAIQLFTAKNGKIKPGFIPTGKQLAYVLKPIALN